MIHDVVSSSYNCYNSSQCVGNSITDIINTTINCYGTTSCAFTTQLEVDTTSDINCHGSYSCYNASISVIEITSNTDAHSLTCYGLFSCASTTIKIEARSRIQCYGEQSCSNSIINQTDAYLGTTANVQCKASHSCINSIILTNSFIASGLLSAQNDVISTPPSTTSNLKFMGMWSGHNATVICGMYMLLLMIHIFLHLPLIVYP